MTILHLLRTSPFSSHQIDNMLSVLNADDKIVLIDDGSYLINHQHLTTCMEITNSAICVVESHIQARNIKLPNGIEAINFETLTELFTKYQSTITW
ncbi:sulfurtransferase complex subunit TusB [Thalassotalea fusca]